MSRQRIGRRAEEMKLKSVAAMAAREAERAAAKPPRSLIVVERPAKPLRPAQCRAWVRKTVAAHLPQVVEGFLNEAARGGCAHLKMVSETVASQPAAARGSRAKGAAELMLEELEGLGNRD